MEDSLSQNRVNEILLAFIQLTWKVSLLALLDMFFTHASYEIV